MPNTTSNVLEKNVLILADCFGRSSRLVSIKHFLNKSLIYDLPAKDASSTAIVSIKLRRELDSSG